MPTLLNIFGQKPRQQQQLQPVPLRQPVAVEKLPTIQPGQARPLGSLLDLAQGGAPNTFGGKIGGSGFSQAGGGIGGGGQTQAPGAGQIIGQLGGDIAQELGTQFIKDKLFGGGGSGVAGTSLEPLLALSKAPVSLGGLGGFALPGTITETAAAGTLFPELVPGAGAQAALTTPPTAAELAVAGGEAGAGGVGALATTAGLLAAFGLVANEFSGGFGSEAKQALGAESHSKDVTLQQQVSLQRQGLVPVKAPSIAEIPGTGEFGPLASLPQHLKDPIWSEFLFNGSDFNLLTERVHTAQVGLAQDIVPEVNNVRDANTILTLQRRGATKSDLNAVFEKGGSEALVKLFNVKHGVSPRLPSNMQEFIANL